jgi:hypothetical protein
MIGARKGGEWAILLRMCFLQAGEDVVKLSGPGLFTLSMLLVKVSCGGDPFSVKCRRSFEFTPQDASKTEARTYR